MDDATALSMIDWLTAEGLRGAGQHALVEGFCDRLVGFGIPLTRAMIGTDLLHPTLDAHGFRWSRGQGVLGEEYSRASSTFEDEAWLRSPFHHIIENRIPMLRCPLHEPRWTETFPLLRQLRDEGATDYAAFATPFGEAVQLGEIDGTVCSFAVDRPGGFRDEEVALLGRLVPTFVLAFQLLSSVGTARTLLRTYLGNDAAERVLRGNIVRGRAETIRAVIWYSDLAGFTRISESVERDSILGLLNDYSECLADIVTANGGEVLKFIGDGMLVIFPDGAQSQACGRTLNAALEAETALDRLNDRRRAAGQPVTHFYLALHVGDLLYGNFGSSSRLDFTVLGPAVNETSRIAGMCRSLDQRIVISSAFAEAAGGGREWLVSLGRYALRGVGRAQELFTIDRDLAAVERADAAS